MSEATALHNQTVLIVDDEPENIRILVKALKGSCVTMAATDGLGALEIVFSDDRPDLVLLDVMMPGMDGYEVCKRMKADPATSDIPVIFITALNESVDEAKGFEAGAADYVTKPFHPDIIQARVMTHLDLKRHRDHLEKLAEQQARQMAHMERLASLGTLASGIAHEIKNGLSYITGSASLMDLLYKELNDFLTGCSKADAEISPSVASIPEKLLKYLAYIREGIERIDNLTKSMNRFSRGGADRKASVAIEQCIHDALVLCHNKLKYNIRVTKDMNPGPLTSYGDKQQLEQVFTNLFINAADAMEGMKKGELNISASCEGPLIRIAVADNGPGISGDNPESIWEPFFSTKSEDKGTGLGLSICRGIIEDHQGKIRVENRPEGGAQFVVELPLVKIDKT